MKKSLLTIKLACCCSLLTFLFLAASNNAHAQLSGVKYVGAGGADYPTLSQAITSLNAQGVGFGGVVFEVLAGHQEVASNLLITATGTPTDSIIFRKSGVGNNPLISAAPGIGSFDGIIKLRGSDYVAFDGINLADPSSNNTAGTQMEWGFALLRADSSNGSSHVAIRNCHITLQNRSNTTAIYSASHDELSPTPITPHSASGSNSYLAIHHNTISNTFAAIRIEGSNTPPYRDHDNHVYSNTITAFGGDSSAALHVISLVSQKNAQVSYNSISGTDVRGLDINGIFALGGDSTLIVTRNTISISSSSPASGRWVRGINSNTSAALVSVTLDHNKIYNSTVSGNFTGIHNSAPVESASVSNDSVFDITMLSQNSYFEGINNATGAAGFGPQYVRKNAVMNINGPGTKYGITGNSISAAIDSNHVYQLTSISNYTDVQGIYYKAATTSSGVINCRWNDIHHITGQGYYVVGIQVGAYQVYATQNNVHDIASGTCALGIWAVGHQTLSRNSIYNISSASYYEDFGDGAANAAVVAIHADAGFRTVSMNLNNNLISSLHSPNSTNGHDVRAIVTNTISSDSVFISYNTVYLNARPSSSYWGSSVLYHNHFNTWLQLNNNIFVNTSEARGSVSAISWAYSNTTLTRYAPLSNNNLFYAGTPSPARLMHIDQAGNRDQLFYAFQQRVAPADSASFSEMPVFLDTIPGSPNYLRIDPAVPTLVESGADHVRFSIGDFGADSSRLGTSYPLASQVNGGGQKPDVGAFEGDYTPAPDMAYVTSETLKSGGDAYRNVAAQQLMLIRIITEGRANRLSVDSFTFGTAITTNISDITRARIYYTIDRNAFDTSLLFGSVQTIGNSFTVKGKTRLLSADTNYFWLAYDIAPSATPGNSIDAECIGIALSSGARIPAPVNPATYKTVPLPLSGTYQVGATHTFPTLTSAISALNLYGINGNVVLQLTDTLYSQAGNEAFPILINPVTGASASDSVLIRSSGTHHAAIRSNNGPAFILNGADHIAIDGRDMITDTNRITVTGTSAAIWVQNSNTGDSSIYNTFRNLNIAAPTIGIGFGSSSISTSGTGRGHHYNSILQCNIYNAGTAIYHSGTASVKSKGTIIWNNSITYGGILVAFQDSIRILDNRLTNITASYFGISLGLPNFWSYAPTGSEVTNAIVSRNEIAGVRPGYMAAVGLAVAPSYSGTNLIDHNVISGVLGHGQSDGYITAGIYIGGGNGGSTKVYFNTVALNGASSRTVPCSYAIAAGGIDPVMDLQNNIFYNTQTAGVNSNTYAIGLGSSTYTNLVANNNAYYTSGPNSAFAVTGGIGRNTAGTVRSNLASLQGATSRDANSVATDPVIDSVSGFKPNVTALITGGTPIAGFGLDKAGIMRHNTTPTIGAYEVLPVFDDAGVLSATVENNDLRVLLRNYGDNYIMTLNIVYSINNGPAVNNPVSLTLPPRDTVSVVITPFTIPNGINSMKIYPVQPNGTQDANALNDTLTMPLSYPLAGTYSIGGTSPDYATLAQAVAELRFRGVSAPVRFHLRSGIYTEQAELFPVQGASATNTVTFTSEAGHADSVLITYAASTPNDNYIVRLSSASYISFTHLSFKATNPSYGSVIIILDSASFDSISYCKLEGVHFTSGWPNTYYNTLVFGNLCYGTGIVIDHNTLTYGGRGIVYETTVDPSRNIAASDKVVFSDNTFSEIYSFGIQVSRTRNLRVIRNTITNNGSTSHYAITLDACDSALQVIGNKITVQQGGHGIQIRNSKGAPVTRGLIASNEINLGDGDGIHHSANGNWDGGVRHMNYYHNTVKVNSANNYAAYFELDNDLWYYKTFSSVDVQNNVFVNLGTGQALRAPLIDPLLFPMTIDYNSLYSNGPHLARKAVSTNYVHDSLYNDLAAWRRSGVYDAHSVSHRPVFTSSFNLSPDPADTLGWLLNGRGTHLDIYQGYVAAGIGRDVNQNERATTYQQGVPDIGAHEFTPVSLPPLAVAIPAFIPGPQPADTTQLYIFHDDTVARITWIAGSDIPALEVRQYAGVRPVGTTPGDNHMYFYTGIEPVGTASVNYNIDLYYREGWKGTNPLEQEVRLAKKEAGTPWATPNLFASTIDTTRNMMHTEMLTSFSLFSGTDQTVPMPVTLSSFRGSRVNADAVLTWITASETNNAGFEIERSADGKHFMAIGFVKGKGKTNTASSYIFTDANALSGTQQSWYYRLKQTDNNGTFDYSNTVQISKSTQQKQQLSVYPNPFATEVYAEITSEGEAQAVIEVFTAAGTKALDMQRALRSGNNVIALHEMAQLENGIYFAAITVNGSKKVIKLVKQ